MFHAYQVSAKKRFLDFNLTIEEFKEIISGDCFYCGSPSQQLLKTGSHRFKYNGIDRIDNNKGYIKDNIVSCCKRCNFSKTSMLQKDFYQWIERLYINLKNNGRI